MLGPLVRSLDKIVNLVLLVQPPQLPEEVLTFAGVMLDVFVVMTVFVRGHSTSFFNDPCIPDLVEHMLGRGV